MENDRRDIGRRTLIGTATAVAAAWASRGSAAAAGRETTRPPGTATGSGTAMGPATMGPGAAAGPGAPQPPAAALWEEYRRTPFTHPQIPYVGRAGSRSPRRRHRARTVSALDHGAVPGGSTDCAPAINRALAAVGRRGGGTVTLPPGVFRIDGVIRIAHSGVVLRGAGSGRTTLLATRHLTELIGPYGSRYGGDKSSWSWAGGLIWLCPEARWTSLVDAIKAKDWPFEGWTGNRRDEWRTLTPVRPARRGDWTITVADPRGLYPGRLVLLRIADDDRYTLLKHMAGGGPGPESYEWSDKTKLTSYVPYEWPVRIISVKQDRVTLERPLPLDLRPEWDPRIVTPVAPLTDAGVEGLTLEAVETPQSPHLLDKGYNGVTFQCAYDCWADDITVRHADNSFGLVAASACTLTRTRVEGRGNHHPYFCREGAHDNLVEDFTVARATVPFPPGTQLHGINVEGLSSHNVWSRGVMGMGTFDTHRGMPFANVRTEITVDNNGRHGGDASAGPLYGARFAHWNVTVTNGRAGLVRIDGVAPWSATVAISTVREFDQTDRPDFTGALDSRLEAYGAPGGVWPPNLHRAQRAL
ncbi:glycosyl hydrolase family 28-related protein [Streptomyces sp. NPDC000594]|uniref:glycosyl hydrolase family 28-related protein n=1 Tax=Streptomyces sp. NPDC000594 TaxID=3154261 RepID=UPI00332C9C01